MRGALRLGSTIYRTPSLPPGYEWDRRLACPWCAGRAMAPRQRRALSPSTNLACARCGQGVSISAGVFLAMLPAVLATFVGLPLFLQRGGWSAASWHHQTAPPLAPAAGFVPDLAPLEALAMIVMGLGIGLGHLGIAMWSRRARLVRVASWAVVPDRVESAFASVASQFNCRPRS